MTENRKFDPAVDGWYFHNWKELQDFCIGSPGCALPTNHSGSCEFDWNMFEKTYLGISPRERADAGECIFFDNVYKKIAENGNCFGISLLALALFKYGGYMGFCSPASFYPASPDSADPKSSPEDNNLHRVINVLQGRQLGARNVQEIIDIGLTNVNDPLYAFDKVKEYLSKGDYPLLSISNDFKAFRAHAVIPYDYVEDPPGYAKGTTKLLYIWDSNHPFNQDPDHYSDSSQAKVLKITKAPGNPPMWSYIPDTPATGFTSQGPCPWILAIPMSTILGKSYQPFTISMGIQVVNALVVSGSDSGVAQLADDKGRRFYTTDSDFHTSGSEIETHPDRRLRDAIVWPWFGSSVGEESRDELYFFRRHGSDVSPLITTIVGTGYTMAACMGKSAIQVNSASKQRGRDIIKTQDSVSGEFSVEIKAAEKERKISFDHFLTGTKQNEWRRYRFKNIVLPEQNTLELNMERKMNAVAVSCTEKEVQFDLEIQQRFNNKTTLRSVGKVSTSPGKTLRLAPREWKNLEKTELIKDIVEKSQG